MKDRNIWEEGLAVICRWEKDVSRGDMNIREMKVAPLARELNVSRPTIYAQGLAAELTKRKESLDTKSGITSGKDLKLERLIAEFEAMKMKYEQQLLGYSALVKKYPMGKRMEGGGDH